MPSARSTASFNPTLTNFAQGLSQDLTSRLAEFMMPRVPVPSGSGQFKKYNEKNQFQVYDTKRAIGGAAARIHFDATDPTYNTKPHALEIGIDDEEREKAGDQVSALERGKISTLVSTAATSREKRILDTIKAGVTAVGGGVGDWTNPDVDPVAQIDAQIIAISIAIGRMPNRIAWGLSAWAGFRNHPKVMGRQPGAALIGLSTSQAAAMFLNPGMQMEIGTMVYDQTKFGKAKNNKLLLGDDVFIFYASPSPDQYDPSFAKCFTTGRGSVESVRSYREESSRSDIYAVDWGEDPQVISTLAVKRITATVEFGDSEA